MQKTAQIDPYPQQEGLLASLQVEPLDDDSDKTQRLTVSAEALALIARSKRTSERPHAGFSAEEAAAFSSRVTPVMGVRTSIVDGELVLLPRHKPALIAAPEKIDIAIIWDDAPSQGVQNVTSSRVRRAWFARLLFGSVFSSVLALLVYALLSVPAH